MPQAALWHVMNMFRIPDVNLLQQQIYNSATVRLAANDTENGIIIFDTVVAQGSITSPQLFNIFINTLLRILTATGQNQGISHGLHFGKNQENSSHDADHGYQFDDIGFVDNISIFAETPNGIQTFLDPPGALSLQNGVAWRSRFIFFSSLLIKIRSEGKSCWH